MQAGCQLILAACFFVKFARIRKIGVAPLHATPISQYWVQMIAKNSL
jgi:hypothetical protein